MKVFLGSCTGLRPWGLPRPSNVVLFGVWYGVLVRTLIRTIKKVLHWRVWVAFTLTRLLETRARGGGVVFIGDKAFLLGNCNTQSDNVSHGCRDSNLLPFYDSFGGLGFRM